MTRTIHVNVIEAFLGPKKTASTIRAYIQYKVLKTMSGREMEETDREGPESDVSQRNAHGYHLWWTDPRQYDVPEPNEGPASVHFEVHANNIIRGDELLASGALSQQLVYQLLTDNPGFIREFDVPIQPMPELIYMNDDGGKQEVYNYRLRVRVLVTPAGATPTAEDTAKLNAPSNHFDAKEEEEGDENNEIGMVDRAMAVQSELGRWPIFRALKLFLFAGIALFSGITSVISLIQEFMANSDTNWHSSNPQDGKRCVRFFDKADEAKKDADLAISTLLYNYNLQNSTIAFCTDATREEMDAKMGADHFFDPAKDTMGPNCALDSATGVTDMQANCEPAATCAVAFDVLPKPYGILWHHTIESLNITGVSCPADVQQMDNIDWPDCDKTNVFVYRQVRHVGIYALFIFSFAWCWLRFAVELFGVLAYNNSWCQGCGPNGTMGYLFRVSFRGLFGPLYYLYLMIKTQSTILPIVTDPPLLIELVMLICEAVPNIALPVYAIVGCSDISIWMLVLLIFGIVKVVGIVLSKIAMLVMKVCKKEEQVADTDLIEVKEAM